MDAESEGVADEKNEDDEDEDDDGLLVSLPQLLLTLRKIFPATAHRAEQRRRR